MTSFFSGVIATIITVPLLGFLLLFTVFRFILEKKRKAFQLSVDLTTILLMYSVYYLGQVIFNISFLSYILIFVLIIAIIFLFLQWKVNEEVHFLKVLKGVWRCNFLFFLVFHFALTIYGLTERMREL
ncbi:DUF3397 domain-containing protein [Bacillus sp. DJP31]|uniref:DUF3397 domain-containing protein n=1 Tax=Bacillus sp. DJP31 TaxID=3409789 RepID=UPI003BB5CD18